MAEQGTEAGERVLAAQTQNEAAAEATGSEPVRERVGPEDPGGIRGSLPSLHRVNGIGTAFYGRRKVWRDGSYATLHCISVLWIPVFPLGGWRVRDEGSGYRVLAHEPLPRWARLARWILPAALVVAFVARGVTAYLEDPDRLARMRWDGAIAASRSGDADAALRRIDDELARDLPRVDAGRAQAAGAEIVRLSGGRVGRPLTPGTVEQATRVVRRYQALPEAARGGAAQAAMLSALDAWIRELGDRKDSIDARLALLGAAAELAPAERKAELAARTTTLRLAFAAARQDEWPLEALAALMGQGAPSGDRRAIDAADRIVARITASPSLLLDAGEDLDAWAAATADRDAQGRAIHQRDLALAARNQAEAEGVTVQQLGEMTTARPWDQHAQIQLARGEAGSGKIEPAIARLSRLGPPGMTVRAARFLLAQLTAAQGKLDAADALLDALLASQLPRFAAASAALRAEFKRVQDRIRTALDTGDVPLDLRRRFEAAAGEAERKQLVSDWADQSMRADTPLVTARARYVALGEVVPMAITAGSIKLRRAHAMSGAAQSAILQDAERLFLAIRSEAEGQPEFRLALGETYARLGKTAESDAELDAVVKTGIPELQLGVAAVYRGLGSSARARKNAEHVFTTAGEPHKQRAAGMLGMMAIDEDREDDADSWLRKAGDSPDVTAQRLTLEGTRLERLGRSAECAAKFAEVAKLHLAQDAGNLVSASNNAAVAYQRGFDCSGDPAALRSAERALETAYRNAPEDPIVVSNLAGLLEISGQLRVLGRHIDAHALRLQMFDVARVIQMLLEGPERDAIRAELLADPAIRRSADLIAQAEVLAPHNVHIVEQRFGDAYRRQDAAAAQAIVDRARRAKGLEVDEVKAMRERARSASEEVKRLAAMDNTRARLEPILSGRDTLSAPTRAAGWYLLAHALSDLGLYRPDRALLVRARDAAATAMQRWPALDTNALIGTVLIDEAGVTVDARIWIAARRLRSAAAALSQLVAAHAPLADQIRASAQWADVLRYARADSSRPQLGDLRLARLLGDTALEARARQVLDDKLFRLSLELRRILDPSDDVAQRDLADLDAR